MPANRPKTIQIFLPDGNARSVRIAEITSRTVQATQIPRSKLKTTESRGEVQRVGVYFLFGEADEEGAKPLAYIGEAENCYQRLSEHHRSKDFWNTAVAITSKTLSFTKAHARYLEYDCLRKARDADRFRLENNQAPAEPHIPKPMLAELRDNFGTIRALLSVLGFPILDPLTTKKQQADTRGILYCSGKEAEARGEYTEDGLVVFEGSTASPTVAPSAGDSIQRRRRRLQENGVLEPSDGMLVFREDYAFNSPSGAAGTVLGRSANGWREWADGWREWADGRGRTLDELER